MRSAEQRHCFLCSAVTRRLADAKPWMPLLSCLPGRLGGDIAWVYAFILHFIPAFFPFHGHLAAFDVFVVSFRATLMLLMLTIRK